MGSPPAAGSPRRRCCAIQGLVVLSLVYVLAVLVLAGGELFLDDQLELRFPSSPGIGSSSSSARVLLSPRSLLLRLGEIARRGGRRWWWTTGGDTGGNRPESDSPRREGGNSSATEACSRRCAGSGQTGMALCLAKQLSVEEDGRGGGNLVFSPLSIYSALTVVTAGARGTTLTELLAALGAPSRDTLAKNAGEIVRAIPGGTAPGGPRVAQACGLWHERTRTLRPAFRETAAASFNAAARAVDFLTNPEEARKEINSWVAAATENLIDTILPPGSVSTHTRLVVASAIYFNGTWQTPFRKENTNKDKFHLLDGGGDIEVDFMRSDRDQYVAAHDGFKVLKMPYTRACWTHTQPPPQYSMCVFLPDERDGLWSLKDRMAAAGGEGFLREHMPEKRVRVGEFRIPRFKLSFGDSVKNALQCLGVKDVFDPAGADLSDVLEEDNSGDPPLFVWDVLHRAVIEVNEEGTEAAAATVLIDKGRARRPSPAPVPVDFVADHPFAFFVVEELSGAVLFAGHVVDPTKS